MTQSNNKSKDQLTITSALVDNKQWIIVYAPSSYLGINWPIRVNNKLYTLFLQFKF